jgi:hypothetical protein
VRNFCKQDEALLLELKNYVMLMRLRDSGPRWDVSAGVPRWRLFYSGAGVVLRRLRKRFSLRG